MFKGFFKLQSDPFNTNPDPRFLQMLPQTREALAVLEYGINARKGFIVLIGEVGTGKTTILQRTLANLTEARASVAYITNPRLESLDLFELILADFGIVPGTRTKSGMLLELNRWLIERFRRQEVCVLVIDEAQNLSPELLEEVRLLTNLETPSQKLLQIVLSGQPELEAKLRQENLRQLRQRISLWCRTQPMTFDQTAIYIRERLRIAGTTETIFLPDAVVAIYQASRGIPRVINLICEHAMIVAYVEEQHQIGANVIMNVVADFGFDTHPLSESWAGGRLASSEGAGSKR